MRKESAKYIKSIFLAVLTAMLLVSCGGGGGGGGMVSFSNNSELHNGGDAGGWHGSGGGNNTSNSSVTGSLSSGAGTFTPPNDIDWSSIELTITVTSDGTTTTHTLLNTETEAIAELLTSLKRGDVVEVTADITMVDDDPRTTSSGAVTIGVGDNHISLPTPYKFSCSMEMTENMYESYYDTLGLSAPTPSSTFSGNVSGICTVNEVTSKLPEATAPGFKFDHWITQDGQTYIPGVTRGDVVISPVFKPDYTCAYTELISDIVITEQQDFNDLINTHAAQDFSGKTITLNCDVSTSTMFSNTSDGFKGEFDGKNHTVQVSISTSAAYYGAELSGLFARNSSTGNIHNVIAAGSVSGTGGNQGYVGGIVGRNDGGIVTACANRASVSGAAGQVGGIAGYNSGTISECYNTGTIRTSHDYQADAGGITGYNNNTITDCYNTGAIYGYNNDSRTGGITGHTGSGGSSATISYCYSTFLPPVSIPWSYGMLAGTTTVGTTSADHFYYDDTRTLLGAGGGSLVSETNISTLADVNNLLTDRPSIWQAGSPYPTLINAPY
ncbi:MAG: hypothetical protein IKK38_12725 [Spirochaetaceae bacterium]|nr:hypothetical protein [Spirochaetaceae bacterium]